MYKDLLLIKIGFCTRVYIQGNSSQHSHECKGSRVEHGQNSEFFEYATVILSRSTTIKI